MKKVHFIVLLFALMVGAVSVSLYQESLEGKFATNTNYLTPTKDTAILNVTNNTSKETKLNWREDDVNILGKWKLSANQNMSIDGFDFHIGAASAIGVSDNFISNFFRDCTLEISSSNQVVESYPSRDCVNAYFGVDLETGKSYTVTLTGSPIETAWEDFMEKDYNRKQVSLAIVAITPANGTQIKHNESSFNTLITQKESNAGFEYTYGGYTLINNLFKEEDDGNTFISPSSIQAPTTNQSGAVYSESDETRSGNQKNQNVKTDAKKTSL